MRQRVFRSRSSSIYPLVITATLLFALSGLMVGFAFGAVVRLKQPTASQDQAASPTARQEDITPSVTPGLRALGCPDVRTSQLQQIADGKTLYAAEVQAEDKYRNVACDQTEGRQQPVLNEGLTCRLWLMEASHNPLKLPQDRIRANALNESFSDDSEVVNGLVFAANTPQTQPCKQGKGVWSYVVSSDVDNGKYYLMGLTSWSGQTYNWSWTQITVRNEKKKQEKEKARDNHQEESRAREEESDYSQEEE